MKYATNSTLKLKKKKKLLSDLHFHPDANRIWQSPLTLPSPTTLPKKQPSQVSRLINYAWLK